MSRNRRAFLRAVGATGAGIVTLGSVSAGDVSTIEIEGGGADIWDEQDECHYYYETVAGDFDARVRVVSLEDTDEWAKAGLMVRAEIDADAANAMVRTTPAIETSVQWREAAGEETQSTTSGEGGDRSEVDDGVLEADWQRLVREGETIRAYASNDGADWTLVASLSDVDLPETVSLGLAVTSHDRGTLARARFAALEGVAPTDGVDVGDVEVPGSVGDGELDSDPSISTDEAIGVGSTDATLEGTLEHLGTETSLEVGFEYRERGVSEWEATETTERSVPGTFERWVTGLEPTTEYEFRAVAGDGVGETVIFTTGSEGSESDEVTLEGYGTDSPGSSFAPDDGFADLEWLEEGPLAVVRVTNLDAEGEGSFTWAVQADDSEVGAQGAAGRLVVFDVGGVIDLGGDERWTRPTADRCFVAGQTAPPPGISFVRGGINVSADDCLFQHVRIFGGHAGHEGDADWHPDSRTDDDSENVVFDHCTSAWGLEQTLSVGYDTDDTTFTNNLIAEGFNDIAHRDPPRGYGTLVGDRAENVTLAGNVWAHNRSRNPRLKNDSKSALVNNVIYNYDWGPTLDDSTVSAIEGNAFLRPVSDNPAVRGGGQVSVADNYTDGDVPLYDDDLDHHDDRVLWPDGLEAFPSDDVLEHNLTNAGARPAERTDIEERILEDVADGTGDWIDHEEEGGDYPDFDATYRELSVPEGDATEWLRQHTRAVELPDEEPPSDGEETDQPPSVPTNLEVTARTETSVDLAWSGSTDASGEGVEEYVVTVDGETASVVDGDATTTTVDTLEPETSYELGVYAVGGDGLESEAATLEVETDDDSDGIELDGHQTQDTTGSGLHNDITGDGSTGHEDVTTFFEHLNSDAVQDNPDAFAFAGDEENVGFNDVLALFEKL